MERTLSEKRPNALAILGKLLVNLRSLIILVLLGVLFTILSPYFLLARNFANIGTQIASVAIGAFGMTFVVTTGGIDLSIGSILALTSIFTGIFISTFHAKTCGWPSPPSLSWAPSWAPSTASASCT